MRAVSLRELRELLQGQPFLTWWKDYEAAVRTEGEARARQEHLAEALRIAELEAEAGQRRAIDAFSEAGGAEEEAARIAGEAQAHEVRALEQVGRFEEQRFRTSDLWYRLGGAEREVEVRREALANPKGAGADADRARAQAEAALQSAEKVLRTLRDEYAQEFRKRGELWDQVEAAWERSFERSLLASEHTTRARRIMRDSEGLFREADERRVRAKELRDEAAAAARAVDEAGRRRAALRDAAREGFGCVAGEAFLYWRHPDDQRAAWAVALGADAASWNVPVRPLEVYLVSRLRGAAFLEPAREGLPVSVDEGDRRFEDYFLGPRQGARPDREPRRGEREVQKP
ncbi:MAG TPA: hypothetical protein VEB43_06260 [Anaeromyxobacter sp.]|nr:hypothetical protein [Anaeromyxobacter sp.]